MERHQIDMWSDFTEWKGKEIKVIRVGATREVQDQNHLLCLVSMQVYNMHGEHLRYSTSVSELGTCLQVRAGQNVSLRDGGKKYGKKEKSRVSAVASEQLTPELSQGVLVARHVDRPWQVAWVHVAQPELLLY